MVESGQHATGSENHLTVSKEPERIRTMFGDIARRYDLLNHLLSLSIDRYWRRRVLTKLRQRLDRGSLVLDLCTGTGDLALVLASNYRIVGSDFAHPMLVLAQEKTRKKRRPIDLCEGDALALPFDEGVFGAVTIAFGLRNLADYSAGLSEMHRVLRPGGWLAVLEFSKPKLRIYRDIYLFYFSRVLPRIGELISGRTGAYAYLYQSVSEFLDEEQMRRLLMQAGFEGASQFRLTGGIATLHLASKPAVMAGAQT